MAVARRHQQRLARAAHHGVDLREVVDHLWHVFGQPHAHDEIDVWQLLAERGHALDVGLARAAALARVGVADIEHVAAGAAVAVVSIEHERRGVAAARLDGPVARRAGDGVVNQSRGNPHARAVHLGAGLGKDLDGRRVTHLDARVGEHLEGRFVHAFAGRVVPNGQASLVHAATSFAFTGDRRRGERRVCCSLD